MKRCGQSLKGREEIIAFNLSGHGHFDMSAYDAYLQGRLEDTTLDEDDLQKYLSQLKHQGASD